MRRKQPEKKEKAVKKEKAATSRRTPNPIVFSSALTVSAFSCRENRSKKEKAATSRRTPNRRPSKLHDFWSALTSQRFSCGESNQRKKKKRRQVAQLQITCIF